MFQGWENFYIMAGTAAATLAGLMFVVITLCAGLAATPAARGVHAFVTPVLVHFGGVLFLSLFVLAPSPARWLPAVLLGLMGLAGLLYAAFIVRLLRRLEFVSLGAGDWMSYAGASALANVGLVAGAAALAGGQAFAPYLVAAAVLLLLFVGIFDAWDLTLWIVKSGTPADRNGRPEV